MVFTLKVAKQCVRAAWEPSLHKIVSTSFSILIINIVVICKPDSLRDFASLFKHYGLLVVFKPKTRAYFTATFWDSKISRAGDMGDDWTTQKRSWQEDVSKVNSFAFHRLLNTQNLFCFFLSLFYFFGE